MTGQLHWHRNVDRDGYEASTVYLGVKHRVTIYGQAGALWTVLHRAGDRSIGMADAWSLRDAKTVAQRMVTEYSQG